MSTEVCLFCGEKYPADAMSVINDQGVTACPRCVFLIALYNEEGVKKTLKAGGLMPHKLNARFQKILKDEFYPHPKETYKKYLGRIIAEEESKIGLIRLSGKQHSAVRREDFPFVFLDVEEAERLDIHPGRLLSLQVGEDVSGRFSRKVWSSKLLTAKEARKHGYKGRKVVCFVPSEEA